MNLQKIIFEAAPQAYYVGGVLRDAFLKRYCADIDLALPRAAVKPAALKLAKTLKAAAFEMDAAFCVWRITCKDGLQIDLTALVGKDIKEDLRRRDFTINALALPVSALPIIRMKRIGKKTLVLLTALKRGEVIDLNGGVSDIKAKTIKANNSRVFEEDPLRLLRAYRAAAELKFKIAPATLALIKKYARLAVKPAGERTQEELKRILNCPSAKDNLLAMDKTGLLSAIFPFLEAQKGCAKVYYGRGGVFTHTLDVVDRAEFLLSNLKTAFPKLHKKLAPYAQDMALYKMAAILHDIAKPATAKEIDGRLRFFHHEEKGAVMAQGILKNLKYSAAETKLICKMIEFHLRPSNLASNEIITDRAVYKFFKELGEAAVPMLLLCWADYTSYIMYPLVRRLIKKSAAPVITIEEGKTKGALGKTLRHMQLVNFLLDKYFNHAKKLVAPRKLIDGRDIMKTLQIQPGPKVGEILEALIIAQVEGKVSSKEEALAWLLANKAALIK